MNYLSITLFKNRLKLFFDLVNQLIKFCFFHKYDWISIADGSGWSIDHDIKNTLSRFPEHLSSTSILYPFIGRTNVVHFPQLHSYRHPKSFPFLRYSKLIVTCFHGEFGINSNIDSKLQLILSTSNLISYLVVSNSLMRDRFIRYGFPPSKIKLIPIGVDTTLFSSSSIQKKNYYKQMLNLPSGKLIIGSFQKDGEGWNDGIKPKLIKGPDIFIQCLKELKKYYEIHVLLSGPARGFVRKELEKIHITYSHICLSESNDIPSLYDNIDLYLMTSREEGGPKSLLECMSSLTPFVATPAGMSNDLKQFSSPIFFSQSFTTEEIVSKAVNIQTMQCNNPTLLNQLLENNYLLARQYDWTNTSNLHAQLLK